MEISKFFIAICLGIFLLSCDTEEPANQLKDISLPILGPKSVVDGDTVYHQIGPYSFVDQNKQVFNNSNLNNKVYVADFFFTSCPVQCPKMSSQMKRLATNTKDLVDLNFVSHAIDFKRDSVERINDYIKRNGLEFSNWYFLEAKEVYTNDVATEEYLMLSKEDVRSAGGYAHSPLFALIDKKGRIRGYYDGQVTEEVDQLEKDIRTLFKQEYGIPAQ